MTSAKYGFRSVFADEIETYLRDKRAAGFKDTSYLTNLRKFDDYCCRINLTKPVFTADNASGWIRGMPNEAYTTRYTRINTSKNFLKYLLLKGYDVYAMRDIRFRETDFSPHIYTDDEVSRYFYQVDQWHSPHNRKDAIQYPVLFRTLYCCGTRITETLYIRKKDVNLEDGTLLLRETKNGCQRIVVMGDDLRQLYNQFADRCFYLLDDDDFIFTNANGGRLTEKTVYEHHRIILKRAGIPFIGDNHGPRVHDWRHHMAVYSFKQLSDSGLDMYTALPILSTYLGHKTIFATEKYVRMTMEIFPSIEEKFSDKLNAVFGGEDDEDN